MASLLDMMVGFFLSHPELALIGGFVIALWLSVTTRSLPKVGNFTVAGVIFLTGATIYVYQAEGLAGIYDKIAFWGFGLVLTTVVLKKLDLFKGPG